MGTFLAVIVAILLVLLLIGIAIYLVRALALKRRFSSTTPPDPETPSTDLEKDLVLSLESRSTSSGCGNSTTSTTASTSSRSESISIPMKTQQIYAEIPILVKPLSLPRSVELIGHIRPLSELEKVEALIKKIRETQDSMKTITTGSNLKCNLIIGVNSSGKRMGGYCINLLENTCHLYTFKLQCLPWNINDEEDNVEIGMKNFLFALILWKDQIKKAKSIRLYTGHESITTHKGDEDVKKVWGLIRHHQQCEKVILVNEEELIVPGSLSSSCSNGCKGDRWNCNYEVEMDSEDIDLLDKNENFTNFVQFIQPAVDLSHWRIKACEKFLSNLYGIPGSNFKKTHSQIKWNKSETRPWFDPTGAYGEFLEKVNNELKKWSKPCPHCGFVDG